MNRRDRAKCLFKRGVRNERFDSTQTKVNENKSNKTGQKEKILKNHLRSNVCGSPHVFFKPSFDHSTNIIQNENISQLLIAF